MGLGYYFMPGNFPDCEIFATCEIFHKSNCTSPLSFHLSSAVNPSFTTPIINFSFFLNQPFNRHLRPLIGQKPFTCPPPPPYIKPFSFFPFHFTSRFHFINPPPPFFSFSGSKMVKTHGRRAFRPRVRCSSPPPASSSSPAAPAVAPPPAAPAVAQGSAAVGSSSAAPASHPSGAAAPAPRRYHTQVGPTPLSPPHSRPSPRSPSSKRA